MSLILLAYSTKLLCSILILHDLNGLKILSGGIFVNLKAHLNDQQWKKNYAEGIGIGHKMQFSQP